MCACVYWVLFSYVQNKEDELLKKVIEISKADAEADAKRRQQQYSLLSTVTTLLINIMCSFPTSQPYVET